MNLILFDIRLSFIITATLFGLVYVLVLKNWWYFSNRNVKFVRGWPIIGSLYKFIIGREAFAVTLSNFYKKFPNERFFGVYEITHPVYIIRDPELVKQINVQSFDHFLNHQGNFEECDKESLLGRTLFFMRDQKWKDMRANLSPAFTGTKMRMLFKLVDDSTKEFVKGLRDHSDSHVVVELKDLLSRFTTNIIATCAFGLKVDAVNDRNNEFFKFGQVLTDIGSMQMIKLLLYDSLPKIMKLLRVKFFDPKLINYFRSVVVTTMNYRKTNNVVRPDMIHLLMQAKKNALDTEIAETRAGKGFEDDDIVAQCLIFFFGGFDTMSKAISFMLHELACNPDIQQNLFAEFSEIEHQLNGNEFTYETLQKMRYMDMVLSETLRRWPPIPSIDREVTKPILLENSNGISVQLTTNDIVWLPVYALHMDPNYWSDPERFDPERFNDENKLNIRSGAYLPFGNGQRSCIAPRFASMVIKTVMYYLLKDIKFEKCEKTQDPLILEPGTINMMAEHGFWVKYSKRL